MRLFETYPPGSALVGVAAALALIGGLEFVLVFSIGVAVGFVAHWLDAYGCTTREEEVTAKVQWFCNACNPSHQERSEGDEHSSGFAETPLDTTPPLGWVELRNGQHICPDCDALHNAAPESMGRQRELAGDWPAHTSPFGASRG